MELPEKPEGAVPLYDDTADNPDRVQIGWFRQNPDGQLFGVGELFLTKEAASKLSKPPHDLSIYQDIPKENN